MKIAVAVDGSENALRAAKHAIFIAHHLPNASLEVIYVVDFNKVKNDYLLNYSPDSVTLAREQKLRPVIKLTEASKIETNVTMLRGNPSREIIDYVNSEPISQLILGSRGLNVFQEMVLGSVSHKVMKHANCPVTIVK